MYSKLTVIAALVMALASCNVGKQELAAPKPVNDTAKEVPKKLSGAAGDFPKQYQLAELVLEESIKQSLKDGDSAKFQNVKHYVSHVSLDDGRKYPLVNALCGQVNAKNSYGAYTGYRSFLIAGNMGTDGELKLGQELLIDDSDEKSKKWRFTKLSAIYCADTTDVEHVKLMKEYGEEINFSPWLKS